MGLLDYTVPSTDITLAPAKGSKPAVTMTVRGLAFADLSTLIVKYGPQLIVLYGRVFAEAQAGKLDGGKVGEMVQTTLVECPELMAEMVVIASDTPVSDKALGLAKKLPPGVQLEAIISIIEHTFVSEAEVKKLIEIVSKAMERAGDLVSKLATEPLPNGFGESDAA